MGLIREGEERLKAMVVELFNSGWSEGEVPEEWGVEELLLFQYINEMAIQVIVVTTV